MTSPFDDPVRAFWDAMPKRARAADAQTVAALVHAAIRDHGWTVEQLVAECDRDLDGLYNPGDRVVARLHRAAAGPRVSDIKPPRPPWCGRCDQETRHVAMDTVAPRRCPDCHPLTQAIPED